MKRNRNKGQNRKGGSAYWDEMQSAKLFQANVGFMDATVNMPVAFRLRFAWELVKGINPITAKRAPRVGGVRDNLRKLRIEHKRKKVLRKWERYNAKERNKEIFSK